MYLNTGFRTISHAGACQCLYMVKDLRSGVSLQGMKIFWIYLNSAQEE